MIENKAKKFIFSVGTAPGQDGKDAKHAKKAIFPGALRSFASWRETIFDGGARVCLDRDF